MSYIPKRALTSSTARSTARCFRRLVTSGCLCGDSKPLFVERHRQQRRPPGGRVPASPLAWTPGGRKGGKRPPAWPSRRAVADMPAKTRVGRWGAPAGGVRLGPPPTGTPAGPEPSLSYPAGTRRDAGDVFRAEEARRRRLRTPQGRPRSHGTRRPAVNCQPSDHPFAASAFRLQTRK